MNSPQNANYGHYLRSLGDRPQSANLIATPVRNKGRRGAVKNSNKTTAPASEEQQLQRPPLPPVLEDDSLPLPELPPPLEPETEEIMAGPHVSIEKFFGEPGQRAEAWFKRYDTICKAVYNYNDNKVKTTFPVHFGGQALSWYGSLSDEVVSDPDRLLEAFLMRFDGSDGGYSFGSVRQRHSENVHDYTTRFQELSNGTQMPVGWLVSTYVDGLVPSLRRIVKPQELKTLDTARRAALRAEASELDCVQVNTVKSLETENKLDSLIELLRHQVHLTSQQQQQQQQQRQQQQQYQQQMTPSPDRGRYNRRREDRPGPGNKGGSMLSAFLFPLLFFCLMSPVTASNILPRLNYGVLFQREAKLTLSREYWLHTYQITLPEHTTIPSINTCQTDKNTCLMVAHVISQLNAIQLETEARLNNTLETVHKLVPHASFVQKSKSKRALLGFIGKFSKTLFGTATVDDVNVLAKHINALTKRTKNLGDALVQHNQHMSSFMQQTNKRMDNLMQGIKANNLANHILANQIKQTSRSLEKTFEEVTLLLVHQLQNSNELNHQLDELKLGILDLANGKLSPLIIPMETLQATLNDVQALLSQKYPGFFVTIKAASEMYQTSNFLYSRDNSVLYITLKIPISNSESNLQLYKVISKPVPINSTSAHATQLLNLPDYFAVSENQQFYVQMSQSQLDLCKGGHHKHCRLNLPLIPVLKDSCSLALFANAKDKVNNFCQFRFIHDTIKPEVYELNSNKVLLYNSEVLQMECNGKHKTVKGCNFCIFDLPCQCSLSTTNFYLPPRLISCKNNSNNTITRLHPVNLILLQQFFDNNQFQHIFADSTFQNPLNVSVPKFKLYDHEISNVLAADERSHLNLSKMVEIAKNDGIVFQTLAEPILDGHIPIQSNWPDLNGILILVAVGLSGIMICMIIYLFCKVKKLAASLIILQQAVKVKALPTTLPSFIYEHNKEIQESSFNFEISLSWEHANFIFLLINTALLIVIIAKYLKFRKTPTLVLEITNMQQCVFVCVMKLPLCPSHSNIIVPEKISDVKISGTCLRPKLRIDWSDFTVQSELTESTTTVPEVVPLNFFQARKLSKILKTPFFVHIHSEHYGYLSPISVVSS